MSGRSAFSRRDLMKGVAAVAAPYIISACARGRGRFVAPSERITLGMIGTGDHGTNHNLRGFLRQSDAEVVAVCDVDRERRETAKGIVEKEYAKALSKGSYKGCAAYGDFREIIARPDIDAVMVSTPDHWHVIPALMAARAGKDVACEKPLTLTIVEGRALADAVKGHKRIFQTCSENRSIEFYHRMCELVRNGRIGKLQHIEVALPRGHSVRAASFEIGPPPPGLDYDMWLGQAPWAPYCAARCHWNFRWIFDYSGGMLTDWGAHMIDLAQWGNDTEHTGPIEVEGKGTFPPAALYNTATDFDISYKYANGVTMNVSASQPGIRFEGDKGWIECAGWRGKLVANPPAVLGSKIGPDEIHLYTEPGGEHRNFLDCVRSRKDCYAPAEVGHRTVAIAHIGNISMLLGRKLKWDPNKERFVGDDEANKMLSRPMRPPWTL
ncbi:Gfo/Idh/MocA family oxidoreductase [Candidatus Sumerlaeota bacterium]|nr:Gfo/Idh/MocA family oxidoreductase [Candidatus Sumerlaeota bacterium]